MRSLRLWVTPLVLPLVTLCAAASVTGCDDAEKKTKATGDEADAGINQAMRDKNIDKALAAAAVASGSAKAVDGPPPTGVFGPGQAETVHGSDAPPKVELMGGGSDPKAALQPRFDGKPIDIKLQVSKRTGPQAYPNIDYGLRLTVGAKAPDGDDDKAKPAASAAPSGAAAPLAKTQPVLVEVRKAALSDNQPGQLPEGLRKQIAKLEGSKVRAKLAPTGGLFGAELQLGKDAVPAMQGVLEAMVESVSIMLCATPKDPVGVGAYWMTTDRGRYQGVNMIRYRVSRVKQAVGGELVVTQDLRQYAASPSEHPDGAPEQFRLSGVESRGKGTWTFAAGKLVPTSGEVRFPAVLQLTAPQQPGRALPLQIELKARLLAPAAGGDDKGDDKKKK